MSKVVYVATRVSSVPRDDAIDGVNEITVIGPSATDVSAGRRLIAVDAAALNPTVRKLVDVLWKSVAGRTLVRIAPVDRSRRFFAAVRRARGIVAAIRDADVIVAADRDALWATWNLARAARGPQAVYGISAAKFALNNG